EINLHKKSLPESTGGDNLASNSPSQSKLISKRKRKMESESSPGSAFIADKATKSISPKNSPRVVQDASAKKETTDEKMSATSFFAQLVRQKQGSVVKAQNLSRSPVVCIHDVDISDGEIVALDLDEESHTPPLPPPLSVDVVDGDAISRTPILQKLATVETEKNQNVVTLPLPPDSDHTCKKHKLSITKDLPMPP
ncbi:unnamed protein product, partial [Allacma fusca]